MSGGVGTRSATPTDNSTSQRIVVSSRDSGSCSKLARRFSPILPFTASALAITASSEPYWLSHLAAVFGPTFGTPGMLSTESPISAR